MSSKQIKLLCRILGCATLLVIGGVFVAAYQYVEITSQYGIDAPFEDFSNNPLLVKVLYDISHVVKGIMP